MTHPDIVQRLLAWEPMISSGYECPAAGVVVAEAATEITTLRQQLADAREALEPFVSGYEHTSIFLRSREKMHEAGRSLYAEDVQRARAIIAKIDATLTPGGNHG